MVTDEKGMKMKISFLFTICLITSSLVAQTGHTQGFPGGGVTSPFKGTKNNADFWGALSDTEKKEFIAVDQKVEANILIPANNTERLRACANHVGTVATLSEFAEILSQKSETRDHTIVGSFHTFRRAEAKQKFECIFTNKLKRFKFARTVNSEKFATWFEHKYDVHGKDLEDAVNFYRSLTK